MNPQGPIVISFAHKILHLCCIYEKAREILLSLTNVDFFSFFGSNLTRYLCLWFAWKLCLFISFVCRFTCMYLISVFILNSLASLLAVSVPIKQFRCRCLEKVTFNSHLHFYVSVKLSCIFLLKTTWKSFGFYPFTMKLNTYYCMLRVVVKK